MSFFVTKEVKFEAAHRLVGGYPGKCKNIHGHSWIVRFTCRSEELDKYGMSRDFGSFKPLKDFIDERFDHSMMVHVDDKEMLGFLEKHGQKAVVFSRNPTSEALAEDLFNKARELGFTDITQVEVMETCTSSARFVNASLK